MWVTLQSQGQRHGWSPRALAKSSRLRSSPTHLVTKWDLLGVQSWLYVTGQEVTILVVFRQWPRDRKTGTVSESLASIGRQITLGPSGPQQPMNLAIL